MKHLRIMKYLRIIASVIGVPILLALAACGGGGGGGGGDAGGGSGSSGATLAPSSGGSVNGVVTGLPNSDLLRAVVREVVREELRDFIREARGYERAPGSANAVNQMTIDPKLNAEAMTHADRVVDQALAKATWTTDDNAALMPYISSLTPAQRIALTEKLGGAINRQELKPLGIMPPL